MAEKKNTEIPVKSLASPSSWVRWFHRNNNNNNNAMKLVACIHQYQSTIVLIITERKIINLTTIPNTGGLYQIANYLLAQSSLSLSANQLLLEGWVVTVLILIKKRKDRKERNRHLVWGAQPRAQCVRQIKLLAPDGHQGHLRQPFCSH